MTSIDCHFKRNQSQSWSPQSHNPLEKSGHGIRAAFLKEFTALSLTHHNFKLTSCKEGKQKLCLHKSNARWAQCLGMTRQVPLVFFSPRLHSYCWCNNYRTTIHVNL